MMRRAFIHLTNLNRTSRKFMNIKLPGILETEFENKWDAFLKAVEGFEQRPWEQRNIFVRLKWVFALSDFVAKSCTRRPDILMDLIRTGDIGKRYLPQQYDEQLVRILSEIPEESGESAESGLSRILREYRCREMIRIAWRDLCGVSDLSETMKDCTLFAEACISKALDRLYRWQCEQRGIPFSSDGVRQYPVVIGLGKLGAGELNFSSDIDLIFAYPQMGKTRYGKIIKSNEEFFSILFRKLIKVLGQTTADGPLFRVDMRLRPFGESGPIVMSFDALESYYQHQGREWERYALIKARIISDKQTVEPDLLSRLKPFIYRRYLDFGAFESLRSMKQMISFEVSRKGIENNVKLGPGGIREIEFFGQVFQMIRGGILPELQEQQIQTVIKVLSSKNFISSQTCKDLLDAYYFLRKTENRLQEFGDRQTHSLPTNSTDRLRLAISMNFKEPENYFKRLRHHMTIVHRHFQGLLETEASNSLEDKNSNDHNIFEDMKGIWLGCSDANQSYKLLARTGFRDPGRAWQLLNEFRSHPETRSLERTGRERIDRLIPRLLKIVGVSESPEVALQRILQLIKTIERRSCYIALMLENPDCLQHLIRLVTASPWIASFISRHPVLLDELIDPRSLYVPPSRQELEAELRKRMDRISENDLEIRMEELCIFKQVHTLRVVAADVTGVLPLMHVSDYLSYIAETVLSEVLDIAWHHLVQRHGFPSCYMEKDALKRGFAVIAYGKLGGLELGYASDLDLIFLHAGSNVPTTGKSNPIDSPQFFIRLGQRVLHILTAPTAAGRLYEVDMRLRPSGSSGMLVSHIERFRDYQLNDAWTWEHQALVRARAIAGDPGLARRFEEIRKEVLSLSRKPEDLKISVVKMRDRIRKEHAPDCSNDFDLKQSPGGMIDIEFIVQYMTLLKAGEFPEIIQWTDNVRLMYMFLITGIMDHENVHILREAYLTYRAMAHRLSLQKLPTNVSGDWCKRLREKVVDIYRRYLGL